jgi:hypothetical protein
MHNLKELIREVLLTNSIKPDCGCGCNGTAKCFEAPMLNENLKARIVMTENLQYHIDAKKPLYETTLLYGSKEYLNLWAEARYLYSRGALNLEGIDKEKVTETNLGEYGMYEGKKVPLDLPMINEGGEDTSWTDEEGNKITLQDILDLTKTIPQKDYPTEKLSKIILNWDDNPEEIERINQVEVSKQYPILIMVDENNNIQWILDGNHRAQKALRSKTETIPAKLIKPSDLNSKAKKILLGITETKLNEAEYQGRKVTLGKPMQGDIKKFKVYVKNAKGKVVKVNFGFGGKSAKGKRMVIKDKNPKRRAAFRARHNCKNPGPRWKARYWSCKKW